MKKNKKKFENFNDELIGHKNPQHQLWEFREGSTSFYIVKLFVEFRGSAA